MRFDFDPVFSDKNIFQVECICDMKIERGQTLYKVEKDFASYFFPASLGLFFRFAGLVTRVIMIHGSRKGTSSTNR